MLGYQHYYWGTTKKVIVAVGSIFENLSIDGDHGDVIRVPLYYSQRSKFLDKRMQQPDVDSTVIDYINPAIGFELTGMNFAPERHTNPLQRIEDRNIENAELYSFNRVPYDLSFSVSIAAKRFEDSLRIVEQILPFFTPEITLTLNDREDFEMQTNLTVVLNSVAVNVTYEGTFDQGREIIWDLNLTAKTFYYTPVDSRQRIKESIIEMRQLDFDRKFESYVAEVVPREAGPNDPHTIVERIVEGDD